MKKLFSLAFIAVLCMALTSCSQPNDNDLGITTIDDLSITADGKTVHYGMRKKEVEQVLGKGDEDLWGLNYSNGVNIGYREDKVVALFTFLEDNFIFQTGLGVSKGDSRNTLLEKLGSPWHEEYTQIRYLFQFIDGKCRPYAGTSEEWKQIEKDEERLKSEFVEVSFTLNENGTISEVLIMNYYYKQNGK